MFQHLQLSLSILLLICLAFDNPGYCEETIKSAWKEAREGGKYVSMTGREIEAAESLFVKTLRSSYSGELADSWEEFGMKLQSRTTGGNDFLVLSEMSGKKHGRGFYLFNKSASNNHLLMVPHGFKDVGTGAIGLRMFLESDLGILALNTVPRYINTGSGDKLVHDLGKLPNTYFAALTKAFLTVHREEKIYQLHGFAREKRKSAAGRSAGVILSGGTERVRQNIKEMQLCLEKVFPASVLVYPNDVRELGGTANIIGKILRRAGHEGFFHIEISREIRDNLRKDTILRRALSECLENI